MLTLKTVTRFLNDNRGHTAVEYGLIATLISVSGLAAYQAMADEIHFMYDVIVDSIVASGP